MNALNQEFRVNYGVDGYQGNPSIAMNNTGKFVTTWQTNGSSNSSDGIYAKITGSDGIDITTDFKVNTTNSVDHSNPAISLNQADGVHNGDYVIGWNGIGSGDDTGVYERRFTINNTNQSDPEYRMNYLTNGVQTLSSIGVGSESTNDVGLEPFSLDYSRMILVWQTRGSTDGTDGIYALRVRNNNFSIPTEFKVN